MPIEQIVERMEQVPTVVLNEVPVEHGVQRIVPVPVEKVVHVPIVKELEKVVQVAAGLVLHGEAVLYRIPLCWAAVPVAKTHVEM